jgi:glycosyltransferase involved in cell wall biosynthesis
MSEDFSADVFAEKENIILFAGRVETRKGAHWLLNALTKLDLKRYGYKAVLAGDLSGEEEIRNWLDDERIIRKIREGVLVMMGSIPRSELITLYKKARIVIVPSVWEVFGYTTIEGMAFGAIVIAHRAGGLTEIIENGVNGFLFDSVDELHSLIEKCMSGYAMDSLISNAIRYVKRHYSTDILVPRFISYYNKVIADHKAQVMNN